MGRCEFIRTYPNNKNTKISRFARNDNPLWLFAKGEPHFSNAVWENA